MMKDVFQYLSILERNEEFLIYYCILVRLEDGMFAVQNSLKVNQYSDFSPAKFSERINAENIELFAEENPSVRCDWFVSLSDAITDHKISFI